MTLCVCALMLGLPLAVQAEPPQQQQRFVASDHAVEDIYGDAVAVDGGRILVGAALQDAGRADTGAAYLYEADPPGGWRETKLIAPDAAAGDGFGTAVDISGDRLVVGAKDDDDNGDLSGSAYLYERQPGGSWQATKFVASDGGRVDQYGESVAIDGDIIVVGARLHGTGGAAYVYEADAFGDWSETRLVPTDNQAFDNFGYAVAVHGDRIVVGAPHADPNGENGAGRAYLFERGDDGQWSQTGLLPSNSQAGQRFGCSVALREAAVLIGACEDDTHGTDAGAAFLFEEIAGDWVHQQVLPGQGRAFSYFGRSVAFAGQHLVIGTFSNKAYVLENTADGWEEHLLVASDTSGGDNFGKTVAADGPRILLGAPTKTIDGRQASGAAYLFAWPPNAPVETPQDDGGTGGDASDDEADPTPAEVGEEGFHLNGTLVPVTDEVDAYALTFGTSADNMTLHFTPPTWADIEVRLISPTAQTHTFDSTGIGGTETAHIADSDMVAGSWTLVLTLKSMSGSGPSIGSGSGATGIVAQDVVHYHGFGVCAPKCRP